MKTLPIKLFVFFFFANIWALTAQTQKVSLNLKNSDLKSFFSQIEKQTDYRFTYRDAIIPTASDITLKAENTPLKELLNNVLSPKQLSYSLNGKNIAISKQKEGPAKTVKGTIIDNTGEPVIGANVIVDGLGNGTITDYDGNFELQAPENAMLKITYIGYEPMMVAANDKAPMHITLKDDTKALEEVVVVGYGTQKKVNLTGSVAAISSDDIKDRVQTNVLSAVQGTVPGVTVISRPGQTPSINFRGRGNLGSSEPLYVIDGAIADATF
ncbi:MAG: carboxypeptidase-like regulatory domain-containing protein, partial [Bacteroidales bacterium]